MGLFDIINRQGGFPSTNAATDIQLPDIGGGMGWSNPFAGRQQLSRQELEKLQRMRLEQLQKMAMRHVFPIQQRQR